MAVSYLLARQADLRGAPLNALAVACALILLATPDSVADVGVLADVRRHARHHGRPRPRGRAGCPGRWWLRAPAALLLTSLSAELALLPVGALVFSRVTFAGLVLNFVAIPLMSVAQVAGMLVVALAPVWSLAADAVRPRGASRRGGPGVERESRRRGPMARRTGFRLRIGSPWPATTPDGRRGSRPGRPARCPVGPPGGAGASAWPERSASLTCGAWILVEPVTLVAPGVAGRLRVTTLDVGHGDAILVQLPDRRSVLVDTGRFAHRQHVRHRRARRRACPVGARHAPPRRPGADARRSGSRGRRRSGDPRLPSAGDLGGDSGAESARDAGTPPAGRGGGHSVARAAGWRRRAPRRRRRCAFTILRPPTGSAERSGTTTRW